MLPHTTRVPFSSPLAFSIPALALALALTACAPGVSRSETLDACVSIDACMPRPAYYRGVGECLVPELRRFDGISDAELRCAASAGADCAAVRACLGVLVFPSDARECSPQCDGDRLVERCTGAHIIARDCTHETDGHGHCTEDDSYARCVDDRCTETSVASCDGNVVRGCADGARVERACPEGTTCGATPSGGVGCWGEGDPCTVAECDDDVLVACEGGRLAGRTDCAALGAECVIDELGSAQCVREDPCTEPPHCEGRELVFCDEHAREVRYDCRDNGWDAGCNGSRCDSSSDEEVLLYSPF